MKIRSHSLLKTYTVTATGTYFVQATSEFEAECIVYETMLGNDYKGHIHTHVLGNGEVHSDMKAVEGFHSTIEIED